MRNTEFTKTQIRNTVRNTRANRTAQDHTTLTQGFTEQLIALHALHQPRIVACYLPRDGEPNTTPYIDWAHAHGTTLLLPIAHADNTLTWAPFIGASHLQTGAFNILEPTSQQHSHEILADAQLLLIPASAVDRTGARLGWGRGYYDRALTAVTPRPPTFALIHEDEIFERIPTEPHDSPIDGAITPRRRLTFDRTT